MFRVDVQFNVHMIFSTIDQGINTYFSVSPYIVITTAHLTVLSVDWCIESQHCLLQCTSLTS